MQERTLGKDGPVVSAIGIGAVNERSKLTRFQRLNLTHLMWCKAPSRAALT